MFSLFDFLQPNSWEVEELPVTTYEGQLYTKSLKLDFTVRRDHFPNYILELRCAARIADLPPWESVMKVHLDNPLPEGIQAQNRVNSLGNVQKNFFYFHFVKFLFIIFYLLY